MSCKRENEETKEEPYGFQGIIDRMCDSEEGVHISDLLAAHTLTGEEQILKVIVAKGPLGEVLDAAIVALMDGNTVELHPVVDAFEVGSEVAEFA